MSRPFILHPGYLLNAYNQTMYIDSTRLALLWGIPLKLSASLYVKTRFTLIEGTSADRDALERQVPFIDYRGRLHLFPMENDKYVLDLELELVKQKLLIAFS